MSEHGSEPPVDPLFRQEAVEDYLRGRDHGALLRVSPLWKHWAFGILVLTFVGAALFAALAPIGIDVRGQAVVRRGTGGSDALEVVCVLPADALPSLRAGQVVVVDLGGAGRERLTLALGAPHPDLLGPERARAWLGAEVGDIPALTGAVALAVARVPPAAHAGAPGLAPGRMGVAHVRVGERSLLRSLALEGAPE